MLMVLCLGTASNAQAFNLFVAAGDTFASDADHFNWRIEGEMYMKRGLWETQKWDLSLKHTAGFYSFWDYNFVSGISWAPSLVLKGKTPMGVNPYVQVGLGPALMNNDKFESDDGNTVVDMGSRAHFESSFAVGLEIKQRVYLRTKVYHYSNAGFGQANEGINSVEFGIGLYLP